MTLDECEKIFDAALACQNEADFCHVVEPLFEEYEILSLEFGRGSIFWRARLIDEEPYENISELIYPPPKCAKRGRLNDSGHPCFYVSARKETAISEIGAKEGQLVQIAGFRILSESPIRLMVIGEYSNVHKNGYMHFAGRDPDMTIARILNSLPRQEALKKIYIDKFFASVLADVNASDNDYRFSRALAQTLSARNGAKGIVFPSVKDRGGFNIGVDAETSDKCFHNTNCIVAAVGKERRFGFLEFRVIKSAERLNDDGRFIWFKHPNQEIIGFYNMSKEEHEIASRNPADRNGMLDVLHMRRHKPNA